MSKGKIRLIGAPPASGKSAVKAALAEELGSGWLVLEHEQVFTPEQRVKTAELAKVEMSSKEFVLGANLPGQLAFQALLRSIADTGINVVGMGPFENVYSDVGGVPLWRKMKVEDFGLYDLDLIYFLATPSDRVSWYGVDGVDGAKAFIEGRLEIKVEAEIQRRLQARATKSVYQSRLDGDKIGVPDYYQRRAGMVCKSSDSFGFPVLSWGFDTSPREFAKKLAECVIA
jgi:hypothetical protein